MPPRWIALAALLGLSCSSKTPAAPTPAPTPIGQALANVKVNAVKTDGFFLCSGGIFITTSLDNRTNSAIRVDNLSLSFTKISGAGACFDHTPQIGTTATITAPPGVITEVRHIDLAGDLCLPPSGGAPCQWLAKATLSTSFGTLTDESSFHTFGF